MLLVGLTGGIGSGKSAVASRFADHGIPVVNADEIAREVVAPGEPALADIAACFGDEVLLADGSLDRAAVARIVFSDDTARRDLNRITHPRIAAHIAERIADLAASDDPPAVVVVDHPLLVETGQANRFDVVVVVEAPEEIRVARLVRHRGMDEGDVRARMRIQADDEARRGVATYVLDNRGDLDQLRVRVDEIVAELTDRHAS